MEPPRNHSLGHRSTPIQLAHAILPVLLVWVVMLTIAFELMCFIGSGSVLEEPVCFICGEIHQFLKH